MLWTAQKSQETAEISSEEVWLYKFQNSSTAGWGPCRMYPKLERKMYGCFPIKKLSVKTPFLLQQALHWLSMPLLTHSVLNNLLLLLLNFFFFTLIVLFHKVGLTGKFCIYWRTCAISYN